MDKLRIGKIPYLNCVLFYHQLEQRGDLMLPPLVPSALSAATGSNAIDAGPVPLVTCGLIQDDYEPLGDHCIATTHDAQSILLFSRVPVDEMNGKVVGVTYQTSTSVRLLKVLLSQYYHVQPEGYVQADEPNDATLLIGDEALRHRRGLQGYEHRYDLGRVWRAWLDLPFMFARWMVRRTLNDAIKQKLTDLLDEALDHGWEHFDDVVAGRAKTLDMTIPEVREYLEGFHFRVGEEEQRSAKRFLELNRTVQAEEAAQLAGSSE